MAEQWSTSDAKWPWWLVGIPICRLLVGLVVFVFLQFRAGIHVTIQNTGSQPLRSVMLNVTGASYSLGDIPPAATAQATLRPTGESHLEIQFTDRDGQTNRLDAGGYFKPGYRGTISIAIKDGVIQTNEHEIRLSWSLP
jgi:hypothetical protein